MTTYIDRTYLETMFTDTQVTRLLNYGHMTTTVSASIQNAKINQLITGSTDIVNSFLVPAGYDLPLASVPASIQMATAYIVIENLFGSCFQPIPESFQNQISQQYGYLNDLKNQKLILTGLSQNTATGTGGTMFKFDNGDGTSSNGNNGGTSCCGVGIDENRYMSVKKLRGTFF